MCAGLVHGLTVDYSLIERLYESMNYDFVALALREPHSPHRIHWVHAIGNNNERFRRIVLRSGIGLAGRVVQTGRPFINNQILALDYQNEFYCPIARLEQLTNVVAVPITTGPFAQVNGVLLAGYRHHKAKMTEVDAQKVSQYLP